MIGVVFKHGIIYDKIPERPIPSGNVLVEMEWGLLDAVINALFIGLMWVEPDRILGSIGLGKVIDVGVGVDPALIGKKAVIFPYSEESGGIGIDVDGVFCERASVPADAILPVQGDSPPLSVLLPYFSVAKKVAEIVKGKRALVVGAGIGGIITTLVARETASELKVYKESVSTIPIDLPVSKEIRPNWDVLVVFTLRGWVRALAHKLIAPEGRIVLPRLSKRWPIQLNADTSHLELIRPVVDQVSVTDLISMVKTTGLDRFLDYSTNILESLPTERPGVIVDLQKNFADTK